MLGAIAVPQERLSHAWPKTATLTIAPDDREGLLQVARADSLPRYQVRRTRIVLAIAAGERSHDIAARVECDEATV